MGKLTDLAERCENATGPDRELDEAIQTALFGRPTGKRYDYTASIDAAMTLVPEGCREWHCGRNIKTGKGQAYLLDPATMRAPIYVHGETPAIALCAAALRARTKNTPDSEKDG